jgi:hypothetical protein
MEKAATHTPATEFGTVDLTRKATGEAFSAQWIF